MDITPFLKKLLTLPGLSGYEGPALTAIREVWQPLTDELTVSRMGSLHGLRRGTAPQPRPRIMLAGHMDAIGLMVTGIVDGFLRITEVGGIDYRILPGQIVTVHARRDLPALVVQPSDRLLKNGKKSKPVELGDLLVDTGLLPEEVQELVRIGDLVSFAQQPVEMAGEILSGHTLDDRAAVAAITVCLHELRNVNLSWDLWAVATVQEEETLAGALTSPFDIRPDIAIAIDVTFAKGPGVSDYRGFPLGKGPTLGLGPNIHPALYKTFKELAESIDMPYGIEPMPRMSGTDAMGLQIVAEGIPTMVIGIPLRYMHTPVETVAIVDINRAGRLLAAFISRLTPEYLAELSAEMNQ